MSRAPTRADVYVHLRDLAEGNLSRDDVEDWACQWVGADDPGVEDDIVWESLKTLGGAASRSSPSEYLYGPEDFHAWLENFKDRVGDELDRIRVDAETGTTVLYRPTGEDELELVAESDFQRWPPRLPGQPIFYPVLNEEYAHEIASRWNAKAGRKGYVTRFRVRSEFLRQYDVKQVGARRHREYWIPAEDLDDFNDNIVGRIEVVAEHQG